MGMMSEFKEFIAKGNVIDMAVGVVIGAAFGKVVTTLVDNVIMPPIGLLIGGIDFSKLAITLKAASLDAAGKEIPAVVIGYGAFLNAVVQFLIVGFAIFLVVKAVNRMRTPAVEAPAATPEDVLLLREIRDSLKK
ncbi:large-conductance mechanosensitive channel protein MscL [Thermomonas sp. HDW16]|uniref:large-conductance mechanosensitive channel protein MscL n=1 Tax=Thermomonas sp. HDW16 TaxID=2714945 RepID=UPI0014080E81|nr:large-conductance mechanosensitive channel protein MscL [Thermomonas sp. HDW16]QIL19934.1 large-conductance mechanosensitive channel protein MscL [Thermomonas sp. HDW16]